VRVRAHQFHGARFHRLRAFGFLPHPGWDLSPFGYITKTIRDHEFFTAGDIPGDCIAEAVIVNQAGQFQERIPNGRRLAGPRG
jgi:hypothetical protein